MLLLMHCRAFLMARTLQLPLSLLLYPALRVGNSTWIQDGFRNTIMSYMCASFAKHGFVVTPPVLALSLVSRWTVMCLVLARLSRDEDIACLRGRVAAA